MGELADRIAVVTGAGTGIGRGIATVMARQGAHVVCTDIDPGPAEETAAGIRAAGGGAEALRQDVTSWPSCQEVAAGVIADHGRIDILVTNAGVSRSVPITDLDEAEWERVNDVNAKGVFLSCKAVIPHMIARRYGKIVNISSMVGKEAIPLFSHYCASKFAVIGLTKVLASEWAGRGVTVNSISPTVVLTELGRVAWGGAKGEALKELIPTGRFAHPEEIAATAVFLASRSADMINGADLLVDGGYTIR